MLRRSMRRLRIDAPCRGERRRHAWFRQMNSDQGVVLQFQSRTLDIPKGRLASNTPSCSSRTNPVPCWIVCALFGLGSCRTLSIRTCAFALRLDPRHFVWRWTTPTTPQVLSHLPVPSTVPRSRIHNRLTGRIPLRLWMGGGPEGGSPGRRWERSTSIRRTPRSRDTKTATRRGTGGVTVCGSVGRGASPRRAMGDVSRLLVRSTPIPSDDTILHDPRSSRLVSSHLLRCMRPHFPLVSQDPASLPSKGRFPSLLSLSRVPFLSPNPSGCNPSSHPNLRFRRHRRADHEARGACCVESEARTQGAPERST